VIRGSGKPHEAFAVKPESRELVADAFFGLWHGSPDNFAKSLKRRSLVIAQHGEVLVDVFRFYKHGLLFLRQRRLISKALYVTPIAPRPNSTGFPSLLFTNS
jgi:hypothetical protein